MADNHDTKDASNTQIPLGIRLKVKFLIDFGCITVACFLFYFLTERVFAAFFGKYPELRDGIGLLSLTAVISGFICALKGIFWHSISRKAQSLKQVFGRSAAPQASPAEEIIDSLGLKIERTRRGIFVIGDINLRGRGYTELPDFSSLQLAGTFDCSDNPLTSPKGVPWQSIQILSDLGNFTNWDAVPERLRAPLSSTAIPEPTSSSRIALDDTTLKTSMKVRRPLQLRRSARARE